MKPKEYVRKYKLNIDDNFNHNEFINDFTHDFLSLIELCRTSKDWNYTKFKNCMSQIRDKWDRIHRKTNGQLPEKLWKYFYATIVGPMRDKEFPDWNKKKTNPWDEWQKKQSYFGGNYSNYSNFFNEAIHNLLSMLIGNNSKPENKYYNILQIDLEEESIEVVKKSYKILAKTYHPDCGGNAKQFLEITEAKNRILEYLKNKGE